MRILVKNIKELVTVGDEHQEKISGEAMAHPVIMQNAYLFIEDGKVKETGMMEMIPDAMYSLFSTRETT